MLASSGAHAQDGAPVQPVAARSRASAEVVASGLEHPWGLAFLPGGRFLVTERPGRLRVVEPGGRLGPPLAGLPQVAAGGQGGLLDVITDADFARNRRIFFCYSEPAPEGRGNGTALASATLAPDAPALQDVKVLFSQSPKVASQLHFGCRIVQAPDGNLFLTLGERFSRKDDAQRLDGHLGKVVRLAPTGGAAPGNPLAGRAGALPEIWSWGHRNPQGATWGPDGRLWIHEHRPAGRRRDQPPRARPQLRLAGHHLRRELWRRQDWRGHGQGRHGAAAALLGAVDRALGHGFSHQRPVRRGLEGQPVRGLTQVRAPAQAGTARCARGARRIPARRTWARASATCARGRTAGSTCSPTAPTGNCCASNPDGGVRTACDNGRLHP
ncbi:NHL repeat containing protein [Alicycliphilus sp. B1]|nr:NHL repeat containing protein [Alicycliphilus sp. B1]